MVDEDRRPEEPSEVPAQAPPDPWPHTPAEPPPEPEAPPDPWPQPPPEPPSDLWSEPPPEPPPEPEAPPDPWSPAPPEPPTESLLHPSSEPEPRNPHDDAEAGRGFRGEPPDTGAPPTWPETETEAPAEEAWSTVTAPVPGPDATIEQPWEAVQQPWEPVEPSSVPPRGQARRARLRLRRRRAIVAAAVAVAVVVALIIVVTRGGSDDKPKRVTAAPASSSVASERLLPIRDLDTGLRIRKPPNSNQLFRTITPKEYLDASTTPTDDRELFAKHPMIDAASATWLNLPGETTEASVTISRFRAPADAQAVKARWRFQEERRLEQLVGRMKDPTYDRTTDPGLGELDIVRFQRPALNQGAPFNVTRYRGTRGPYVFEVTARQRLTKDGALRPPVLDPAPSIQELFTRLSAELDRVR